jgi:hypothetical protein
MQSSGQSRWLSCWAYTSSKLTCSKLTRRCHISVLTIGGQLLA